MDKYIKEIVKEEVKNALKGSPSAVNLPQSGTSAELQTPLATSTIAVTSTQSVASTVQHARG